MNEIRLNLSDEMYNALELEAKLRTLEIGDLITKKLSDSINMGELTSTFDDELGSLKDLLLTIPCVKNVFAESNNESSYWAIKLQIDINSTISWHFIQELGHVLNYLSLEERLPTKFYPVSPPPYLNGGPDEFLSWIIESDLPYVSPEYIKEYLKSRLPDPLDDIEEWQV